MTTRRIGTRTETYQLGHLKLYRDDLEQIAKAVVEAGDLRMAYGDWEMTTSGDDPLLEFPAGRCAPGSLSSG